MLGIPTRKGVTIIEIMIVVSILSLLIGLLLPTLNDARERARYTKWSGTSATQQKDSAMLFYYNMEGQPNTDAFVTNRAALSSRVQQNTTQDLETKDFDAKFVNAGSGLKWTNGRWKHKPGIRFSDGASYNGWGWLETKHHQVVNDVFTDDYAAAFWIKKEGEYSDWQRIVGKGSNDQCAGRTFGVYEEYGGNVVPLPNDSGGGRHIRMEAYGRVGTVAPGTPCSPIFLFNSSANFSRTTKVGNWHHVVVTHNNKAGQASMFLDGQICPTVFNQGFANVDTTPFTIGRGYNFYAGFWGIIDEVAVYNRTVDGVEAKELFEAGLPGIRQ